MEDARLKSRLRVQAMLRQAATQGVFGAVLRQGDADAGSLVLVLRGRQGLRLFSEAQDRDGQPGWLGGAGGTWVDQAAADAYQARRVDADPDCWVVEFEAESLPFEARIFG